jgi:hypothetical protein
MTTFFAALLAAITFGTVWGWIIFVVAFIIITALVENEKGFWAFLAIILTVVALCTPHFQSAVHFIVANPGKVVLMVLGYFVVGTVWGIIKWFLHVNRELERYNEKKAEWLQHYETVTPGVISTSEEALAFKNSIGGYGYQMPPQAREHKSDILLWMSYWPFSCLWTLINDPIRKIFRTIYTHIATSLQKISDRMFKGAMADLALAKEAEEAEKAKQEVERAANAARRRF